MVCGATPWAFHLTVAPTSTLSVVCEKANGEVELMVIGGGSAALAVPPESDAA
jgi:hypothetical protein